MNKYIFYLSLIAILVSCSKSNPFTPQDEKTVTNTKYVWYNTATTNLATNYIYLPPAITNVVIYTNTTDQAGEATISITSNMYNGANLEFVNVFSTPSRRAEVGQWTGTTWLWLPYVPGVDIFCQNNIVVIVDPAKERLGKIVRVIVRWTETNYIIVTNN